MAVIIIPSAQVNLCMCVYVVCLSRPNHIVKSSETETNLFQLNQRLFSY